MAPLSLYDNELCRNLAFYVVILIFKFLFLGLLTTKRRLENQVFINQEDVTTFYDGTDPDKLKPILNHPGVERARMNVSNDLENIPIFIILSLFYVFTEPSRLVALWFFRIYTAARIGHTICYQMALQPWRFYCHLIGQATIIVMATITLMSVM